MIKYFPATILFFLSFIGCNDNPTEVNDDLFNVEIQVVNLNGNPLQNINVSTWNKINYSNTPPKMVSGNSIKASSSIMYTLPERCYIELKTYLLNGALRENVISGYYEAGAYQVTLNMNDTIGTGVYKVKMITSSDSISNNIIFQDSIYIVLWQPDPVYSIIGKTDNTGKIRTNNKLFFPHLLGLTSIPHTIETGPEIINYFTLSDTVVITLSDESFTKNISYEREIKNGKNEIKLTWDDTLQKYFKHTKHNENNFFKSNIIKDTIVIPTEWRLYQNYPNPFN